MQAQQAVERLKAGNRRFVSGVRSGNTGINKMQRAMLTEGQAPFAIILGCSDSRVPAEIIFDQGLGDLFVIRVAGNIVAPSQIGSVEFAAQQFGTQLVVVLGHTACGAIKATIDELRQPADEQSANIAAIVSRVRPSVEGLLDQIDDPAELVHHAVRENVRYQAEALRHGSTIIEYLVGNGDLVIVGAEYNLETGVVEVVNIAASDDVGTIINPMIVDGQIHGGLAQGIGQALLEQCLYDESGQLLTGSYMNYCMPRAADLPFFKVGNHSTPCTHNPIGAKGVGEVGSIGVPPAVINAVLDALRPLGVDDISMPATPEKVWRAIQQAKG